MEYQRRYKLNIAIVLEHDNSNVRLLTEAVFIKLRCVSAKYSQWARYVELVTEHSDFKGFYEEYETPLLSSSYVDHLLRFPLKRKRKDGRDDDDGYYDDGKISEVNKDNNDHDDDDNDDHIDGLHQSS